MDNEPVKTHVEIKHALWRHFDSINNIIRFKSSTKVFIPENNLGNEATHMASMLKKRTDVKTYWQTEKKPGINKDHKTSDNYQFLMDTKLNHDGIRFDGDFFTNSKIYTRESIKDLLKEQMLIYHYEYDPVREKGKLTGKMGDKQDDLLIATMQCLYYGRAAARDPRRIN